MTSYLEVRHAAPRPKELARPNFVNSLPLLMPTFFVVERLINMERGVWSAMPVNIAQMHRLICRR